VTLLDLVRSEPSIPGRDPALPPVISSRVRLARNFADAPFPGRAGEEAGVRLWERIRAVLCGLSSMPAPVIAGGNEEIDELGRQVLLERHLISREHAGKGRGSGVVLSGDGAIAVLVNEEDHLRLQAMLPGLRLEEAWSRIDDVDTELERAVEYAFSPRWGYLTACPSNVGTGMRASVMLHLPGLVLMDEMGPVVRGIQKIGLAVRGLQGEGTAADGHLFQVSNQMTLGEREADLVATLDQIVREIVGHEMNARARLRQKREALFRDRVGRAAGVLANAHVLSSKEALDLLSVLRLGGEAGIIKIARPEALDRLMLWVQPGHVQWTEGRRLSQGRRDQARADRVRAGVALAIRGDRRRGKSG